MSKLYTSMHSKWQEVFSPIKKEFLILEEKILLESKKNIIYPNFENILRVFQMPPELIKVIIVGQDPYPKKDHAIGLSFSVDKSLNILPKSLKNIFIEYQNDLNYEYPLNGDLSSWEKEGVFLLNTVLTVERGKPNSHKNFGWERITDYALKYLNNNRHNLVAITWGMSAQKIMTKYKNIYQIKSPHPSPLSAYRGFLGSKPFTKTNEYLISKKVPKINWKLN